MPEGGVGIVRWFLWSDEVVVENGAGLTAAHFSGYDGATTEYFQRPKVLLKSNNE